MRPQRTFIVVTRMIFLFLLLNIPGGERARHSHNPGVATEQIPKSSSVTTLSAQIGRDVSEYRAHALQSGATLENPAHRLSAHFTSQGVEMRTQTSRWNIALQSIGYGEQLRTVTNPDPSIDHNRVEYRRGALTEWYVNGPLGLEQGFTVGQRPGSEAAGALTIAMRMQGDLKARVDQSHKSLLLTSRAGQPSMRYGGLAAYDAAGKELPVWLEVRGTELLLRAEDSKARYPITIDPFVQTAELTASDAAADKALGLSVAISGNTVVAGCFGSVYVFTEPSSGWTNNTQTAKLISSDGVGGFGFAIGISGNTVAVGAHDYNNGQGAIYVYVEPPNGWPATMTQTARLTITEPKVELLGRSVAISGDTIVGGAPGAPIGSHNHQGAAYVFVKPAGGWADMTPTAKLNSSDGLAFDELGYSVGIDGNSVVAGAEAKNSTISPGAAYLFAEPAGGWVNMTQTAKLTASDGITRDRLGNFVAISGNTVIAGAPAATIGIHQQQGAAYVFVEPPNGWADMTQTAKLTSSDGTAFGFFGRAVAISGGNVVIGAPNQSVGTTKGAGTVYEFAEPATGWVDATETNELTAQSAGKNFVVGCRVGIDGSNVVAGAAGWTGSAGSKQGAALIFVSQ